MESKIVNVSLMDYFVYGFDALKKKFEGEEKPIKRIIMRMKAKKYFNTIMDKADKYVRVHKEDKNIAIDMLENQAYENLRDAMKSSNSEYYI